jgi:DHA2 family multidrug resistance protein
MNAAAPAGGGQGLNRGFITASIMAAALMQTLDTTIANVALPHIQGSVSASQDQIVWVLTFYIVAAAIMTPLTGWLSERIGRKTLFLFSVAGFTVASALCGAAQSLGQIVAFRFIQGVAGAALMPLAQAVLLDINPPERYGQAMATFASAVVLGPIVGPTLGGWLTEDLSWRWVFYINLPLGALAFLGAWLFMPGKKQHTAPKFDFFGYFSLAVGIAALQLMLDRGQTNDWFGSPETWVETAVAGLCLYLFLVHYLTAKQPLFSRELFKDQNFRTTAIASLIIMGAMYASLALVPPMLQNLYGYPVFTAGVIIMPRGIGAFLTMVTVGRLLGKIDARILMGLGLVLLALSFWLMSRFALDMGSMPFIVSGFVQGLSMGLIWVPMSTIGFATLPQHYRVQGATISNLIRNVGGSIGISALQVLLVNNMQVARSSLVSHVRPDNPVVQQFMGGPPGSGPSVPGMAMVNGMAMRQAAMIAYIDNFWLMAIVVMLMLPTLLLLRPPRQAGAPAGLPAE